MNKTIHALIILLIISYVAPSHTMNNRVHYYTGFGALGGAVFGALVYTILKDQDLGTFIYNELLALDNEKKPSKEKPNKPKENYKPQSRSKKIYAAIKTLGSASLGAVIGAFVLRTLYWDSEHGREQIRIAQEQAQAAQERDRLAQEQARVAENQMAQERFRIAQEQARAAQERGRVAQNQQFQLIQHENLGGRLLANGVRLANPPRGLRLQLPGIPNLPGFYHMVSQTPYRDWQNACGLNAAYSFAWHEAQVLGREFNDAEFERVRLIRVPEYNRGLWDGRITDLMAQFNQVPVIPLGFYHYDHNYLPRINLENYYEAVEAAARATDARVDDIYLLGGARDANAARARAAFPATIAAAHEALVQAANGFRGANGPRIVHFLCCIPGHWIAIMVTRNAQGEQAMYLYDNLNNNPVYIAHMRRHIENIYNRFFN